MRCIPKDANRECYLYTGLSDFEGLKQFAGGRAEVFSENVEEVLVYSPYGNVLLLPNMYITKLGVIDRVCKKLYYQYEIYQKEVFEQEFDIFREEDE